VEQQRPHQKGLGRLIAVTIVAVLVSLGMSTLASAQAPDRGPKVKVGGKLVDPPDMSDAGLVERGPDGKMRVKADAMVPLAGPDGKDQKDANGKTIRVPLNNPPPQALSDAESAAATARAKASGAAANEGTDANGNRPSTGTLQGIPGVTR